MTYVFDEEGREMPVREITWGRLTIAWTIFFVIAVAAIGVFQYRLNKLQTKEVMFLAGQQAKTAERVRVLERRVAIIEREGLINGHRDTTTNHQPRGGQKP
ncbi:MAG: hypothetical protein V3W37_03090 [Candidatus Binatia bacterium]